MEGVLRCGERRRRDVIDRYLEELRRALPWGVPKRRILAEAEDHLREAARSRGEKQAVAEFGDAAEIARRFARATSLRLAAAVVLVMLVSPVLAYPIVENSLPPAPWPGDAPPEYLHWKQDRAAQLFLLSAALGLAAVVSWRRGGLLRLGSLAGSVVAFAAGAGMTVVLSVQWADAVPGTPGWLVLVPVAQFLLVAAAAGLLARAIALRRV
jgi:HAAS